MHFTRSYDKINVTIFFRRTTMKSKVYFTRKISPASVLELYKMLGFEPSGKVAIKVHSGETGNQNFLRPEFWADTINHIGGTVDPFDCRFSASPW